MKYLTPERYGRKLTELPDRQFYNYLDVAERECENPDEWFREALNAEAQGQKRQDRIAALNKRRSSL